MRERMAIWLTVVALMATFASSARTQAGPLDDLFTARRVDADPNKDYQLTQENGPWLIMACTFSGENAYEQARDLALELRRQYKLPAYLYSKTFEHEVGDSGRGTDQFGGRLDLKYRKGDETTEVAVLVGDFPAIDDSQAQKTLDKIKKASPDCLQLDPNRPTAQNLASWRLFFKMAHDVEEEKGPMWKAFMVANPLLPKEYFAPSGLEKFVVDLNRGRPYNLLECPGRYTVQVAHFTGQVEIDQARIQEANNGGNFGGGLVEAGEKAELMTRLLREKGYEAYEFHDRYASIVTIGSFDSVGTPRADGKTEINPEILKIMKVFGAENGPTGTIRKDIGKIPFDMQPIPVEVPRASISASYASNAWQMR